MNLQKTTWLVELLERAKRNLAADQYKAAKTRLGYALAIAIELRDQQKADQEARK